MKILKPARSFLAAFMAAAIVTCAVPVTPVVQDMVTVEAQAASPRLSLSSTTLLKGATIPLKVKNTKSKATWSSSNKKVASVSQNGTVKAVGYGKATITANVNGQKLTCKVSVKPSLSVNKKSVTVKKGKYTDVKVTYLRPGTIYAEGVDTGAISAKWLKWKGHVATLRIYGKYKGTAKIKFSNTYDKRTCSLKVTVK